MNLQQYERTHLAGIVATHGHIASYLSMMATHANYRRKGVGRALIDYAHPLTGAQRIDLVTDTAEDFYASYEHHRTFAGFRIYP